MSEKPKKEAWGTAQVRVAILERYAPPVYAAFCEVPDATGARHTRTADVIVKGCWPSRSLDLVGFEIKASRSDWKKELDDPKKADAFFRYCHQWYLAVGDADIVKPGELPDAWGLMAPRGDKLVVVKEAPRQEAKPPSSQFFASLCRSASDATAFAAEISLVRQKARQDAYEEARKSLSRIARPSESSDESHQIRLLQGTVDRLRKEVADFEQASGISLAFWGHGRKYAEALKFVVSGSLDEVVNRATAAEIQLKQALRSIEAARAIQKGIEEHEKDDPVLHAVG